MPSERGLLQGWPIPPTWQQLLALVTCLVAWGSRDAGWLMAAEPDDEATGKPWYTYGENQTQVLAHCFFDYGELGPLDEANLAACTFVSAPKEDVHWMEGWASSAGQIQGATPLQWYTEAKHFPWMVELERTLTKAESDGQRRAVLTALARMLMDWGTLFVGAGNNLYLLVNDTFHYASADAEALHPANILWLQDAIDVHGDEGAIAWASEQRGQLPLEQYRTPKFEEALAHVRAWSGARAPKPSSKETPWYTKAEVVAKEVVP